jgi:hypothetical protein
MLEAVHTDLVFTISLKRSTQNLQLSTSSPADYPIYAAEAEVNSEHWRYRHRPLRVDGVAVDVIQAPKLSLESCATNSVIMDGPRSSRCCPTSRAAFGV